MDFHIDTIDGLRAKNYTVGDEYVQTLEDGSAHHFISVDGVHMPYEYARDMNRGLVTLEEIRRHLLGARHSAGQSGATFSYAGPPLTAAVALGGAWRARTRRRSRSALAR